MMDWENDPELKKMRADYRVSLRERIKALGPVCDFLRNPGITPLPSELRASLQMVAHKVAGTAGSYGFPALSEISGALDDFLDLPESETPRKDLDRHLQLLMQAMESASEGRDSPQLLKPEP